MPRGTHTPALTRTPPHPTYAHEHGGLRRSSRVSSLTVPTRLTPAVWNQGAAEELPTGTAFATPYRAGPNDPVRGARGGDGGGERGGGEGGGGEERRRRGMGGKEGKREEEDGGKEGRGDRPAAAGLHSCCERAPWRPTPPHPTPRLLSAVTLPLLAAHLSRPVRPTATAARSRTTWPTASHGSARGCPRPAATVSTPHRSDFKRRLFCCFVVVLFVYLFM